MIKNYLKVAWRNIIKNKVFSVINILGLSIGMAIALLIGLWVTYEYSYDKFLPNYTQLYRVELNFTSQHDGEHTQSAVSLPLAEVLRKEIPEIKKVAETDWVGWQYHDLLVGDKKIYLGGGATHPDFLNIFQYPFVKGNAKSALTEMYSIVLTESTAKVLFGDVDPINKYVRFDNKQDLKVTGVLKDIPQNATLQFGFLTPFSFKASTEPWIKDARVSWANNSFNMFLELQPGVTFEQVAPKIRDLEFKHSPQMRNAKPKVIIYSVKNWHLYTEFKNGKEVGGYIDYVRLFAIIGILVLFIACINFMNLVTAKSEKRGREVGIRKAIGSNRLGLIFQFLSESVLLTFIAFVFAIVLTQLALPAFNALIGSSIKIPFGNPWFWCIMLGYVLFTGVLAGSRPAFYLSSFNPVKILKGTVTVGKTAALPRQILVVLQFSCSIALIISTIIVYQQMEYGKNRPTGYFADRLAMTDMSGDLENHYKELKNDLIESGAVEAVATASSPITNLYIQSTITKWPGKNPNDELIGIGAVAVSDTYIKTLGMTLIDGHDFSNDLTADTNNIIVNEALIRRIGLKKPINQIISYNFINHPVKIIGVLKDAVMESPYTPVEPTIFNHGRGGNSIMYRLSANVGTHAAIEKISKVFNKYNPAYPFSSQFVDDEYNHKFNLEVLISKISLVFAGLTIFISCLGLFGLAAFIAEQRTKEIGIRKVLGASILRLWLLLSKDFVLLVLISCVIASGVAFYMLSNWLQKYNYHITISFGVFVLSGFVALTITMLTISFQAIKAAITNPVKSLRSE